MFNGFGGGDYAVYEVMWKNTVERGRQQMKIWRMRIACCVPKAINTPSDNEILIAFPQQQWWQERASMLGYTYTACLLSLQFLLFRNAPMSFCRWFHSYGFLEVPLTAYEIPWAHGVIL